MADLIEKKPLNLEIKTLSAELSHPLLKTGRHNQSPTLVRPFTGAIGIVAAFCGCLACIFSAHQVVKKEISSPTSIAIYNAEPENPVQTQPEQDPSHRHPERIATNPIPPLNKTRSFRPLSDETPAIVAIPRTEIKLTDFDDVEKLDLENLFPSERQADEPEKDTDRKSTVIKPVEISKKENAKKLAEQKRRARTRQKALAERITKGARVVSQASPVYPQDARRKKIQGRVIVAVTVSKNGKVIASSISQSSGNTSLDNAALQAAGKFRFKAAINGLGQTIKSSKRIPFNFQLKRTRPRSNK
ncbi:MAG: TonB family protein [Granulosicoccus sp.]|jgi:TonB family protein